MVPAAARSRRPLWRVGACSGSGACSCSPAGFAGTAADVGARLRAFLASLERRVLGDPPLATLDAARRGRGADGEAEEVRAAQVKYGAILDAHAAACPPKAVAKLRRRLVPYRPTCLWHLASRHN